MNSLFIKKIRGECEIMKFKCEKCLTQYIVNNEKIPAKGGKITCRICKHIFKIHPPGNKKSIQKKIYSQIPVIVFTPDAKKIKQLEKLLQKSRVRATFFNSLKDVKQYFSIDNNVPHQNTQQNQSGIMPVTPNIHQQYSKPLQEFGYHDPHSTDHQQEYRHNMSQDYCQYHQFPDHNLNTHNEFDYNTKKRAKVYSGTIYRQFDTPLEGPEDSPLIEDSVAKYVSKMQGPLGLDIGTSHIVLAGNTHNRLTFKTDLNAFFTVPSTGVTKRTLKERSVPFFISDQKIYVCGYAAQNFANIFNTSMRRPIEKGLISPNEKDGFTVIRAILEKIVPRAESENQEIAYTIPGAPPHVVGAVTYHSSVIMKCLKEFGYKPIPVNEGFATIISELPDDAYTGIGISMGGGMCNVCLSYMAVPIMTYSIQKGGDYIDEMVSKSVGESITKVKMIKEEHLNLNQPEKGRISTAFSIFYDELIAMVIDSFSQVLDASSKIPRISKPLPIVVSGGTAMPQGFEKRFANALSNKTLPLRISEVRIADKPLYTTAKGAMTMAISGGDIYPGGNNG